MSDAWPITAGATERPIWLVAMTGTSAPETSTPYTVPATWNRRRASFWRAADLMGGAIQVAFASTALGKRAGRVSCPVAYDPLAIDTPDGLNSRQPRSRLATEHPGVRVEICASEEAPRSSEVWSLPTPSPTSNKTEGGVMPVTLLRRVAAGAGLALAIMLAFGTGPAGATTSTRLFDSSTGQAVTQRPGDVAATARRATHSAVVPAGLQAAINKSLAREPVTSPAGLSLTWGSAARSGSGPAKAAPRPVSVEASVAREVELGGAFARGLCFWLHAHHRGPRGRAERLVQGFGFGLRAGLQRCTPPARCGSELQHRARFQRRAARRRNRP